MDFGTVMNKLDKKNNSNGYDSPAAFSKDVNRVFSNVLKVVGDLHSRFAFFSSV